MAQHMQESGVAHGLINVSVKKETLPHGFVPMHPGFYHSCSAVIQYNLGPSLRDLSCISALLGTIEIRQ